MKKQRVEGFTRLLTSVIEMEESGECGDYNKYVLLL